MKLGRKEVGLRNPVYFIADIASNHDGDLERAKRLIYLAQESGADAVKFQNFNADTIVSDYGFQELGRKSHQSEWGDSVYNTYKKYEVPPDWIPFLKSVADSVECDFITTPYDLDIVPGLNEYVCAWKLGSGDITWKAMVETLASYDKPLLIGTGASTDEDIARALRWTNFRKDVVLMHCNTNYTGEINNLAYANLSALVNWWGGGVIGLSDHTYNEVTALGAVALGACIIEKHFTDDNQREGPDHKFSLNPITWLNMVNRVRELELALGDGVKKVEENEEETVILQRRAIRTTREIGKGEVMNYGDLACLRPCPRDAVPPYNIDAVYGRTATRNIPAGDYLKLGDFD